MTRDATDDAGHGTADTYTVETSAPGAMDHAGELPRGATLGRYVVLDRLGAGGMGVVYTAYDPELDRKVALKLLRTDHALGRARLLREAQALGRLAHPNVVAVHDVGATERHVFVAMEFIHGATLTRHLAERALGWQEVLALFVAVGRGVAAAHQAGLVHRDLKPDNVMVASDGRVRVLDFGLARAGAGESTGSEQAGALAVTLTHTGKLVGTPRYMAPEQWLGLAVDARSDQFALCVSLWEALFGEHPFAGATPAALMRSVTAGRLVAPARPGRAPGWLRRLVARGLALAPGDRFGSVDELLAALTGGQARRRRRRAAIGVLALVGVAGLGAAGRSVAGARARAACEAAGAEISAVWNDEVRGSLQAALVGTGLAHASASFERMVPWIDRWRGEWARTRTAVCSAAEIEGAVDPPLVARAGQCLGERRAALEALLAALARPDAAALAQAVPAAASLPPPAACGDWVALARVPTGAAAPGEQVVALRHALVRARGLAAAGHPADGLEVAAAALSASEALGEPTLVAEARALVGTLAHRTGDLPRAEAALTQAFATASEHGADELAASAAIGLSAVVGHAGPRHAEGLLWAEVAAPLVRRLGQDGRLLGADLRSGRALVEQARGAYAEAMAQQQQVLEIRERELGPEHPAVAATLDNLAIVHGLLGEREREAALFERALALQERALGPDHPEVARTLHNLAIVYVVRGALDEALAAQLRAREIWRRALPPAHTDIVAATINLARIHGERGELDQAIALGEQALVLSEQALGPDHPEFAQALNNVATLYWERDDLARVQALLTRSLAIQEKVLDREHPDLALALYNLASVHAARGEVAEAQAQYTRALAIQERAMGREHRILAHALQGLAELAQKRGRPDEATPLLERAVRVAESPEAPPGLRGSLRLQLAGALWQRATAGDRSRARELAAQAETELGAAGDAGAAAGAASWLREHPAR